MPAIMLRRRKVNKNDSFTYKINTLYYNLGTVSFYNKKTAITVYWGDGTSDSLDVGDNRTYVSHVYSSSDEIYIIKIIGSCGQIKFGPSNIIEIVSWGNLDLDDATYMLWNQTNLKKINAAISGMDKVTKFSGMFYNCPSLESLPEKMFDECISAVDFNSVFYGCGSLVSLPENLFSKCKPAVNFVNAFRDCYSLVSVPENILHNDGEISAVGSMFSRCTSLVSIPENLFKYCIYDCTFGQTFAGCSSVTGNVPRLWEIHNPLLGGSRWCFEGCVNADNYDEIPEFWK